MEICNKQINHITKLKYFYHISPNVVAFYAKKKLKLINHKILTLSLLLASICSITPIEALLLTINNSSERVDLVRILRDGSTREVASLSLSKYPPDVIAEALYNLSSAELPVALGKINSSNQMYSLFNLSSHDLARILNKLSFVDLTIALKYDPYAYLTASRNSIGSILDGMPSDDLNMLLNQRSTKELIVLLDNISDVSRERILTGISIENVKNIVHSLSPNEITVSTASAILRLWSYQNILTYGDIAKIMQSAPFSAQDVAFSLQYFPENKTEPFLNTLPVMDRAQILRILAKEKIKSDFIMSHLEQYCPPGFQCAPPAAFSLPSMDFPAMINILLTNATSTQIKEIPLIEYSSDDLAKALQGLPQEKRAVVLDSLPSAKRSEITAVLQNMTNN